MKFFIEIFRSFLIDDVSKDMQEWKLKSKRKTFFNENSFWEESTTIRLTLDLET